MEDVADLQRHPGEGVDAASTRAIVPAIPAGAAPARRRSRIDRAGKPSASSSASNNTRLPTRVAEDQRLARTATASRARSPRRAAGCRPSAAPAAAAIRRAPASRPPNPSHSANSAEPAFEIVDPVHRQPAVHRVDQLEGQQQHRNTALPASRSQTSPSSLLLAELAGRDDERRRRHAVAVEDPVEDRRRPERVIQHIRVQHQPDQHRRRDPERDPAQRRHPDTALDTADRRQVHRQGHGQPGFASPKAAAVIVLPSTPTA